MRDERELRKRKHPVRSSMDDKQEEQQGIFGTPQNVNNKFLCPSAYTHTHTDDKVIIVLFKISFHDESVSVVQISKYEF